MNGTKFTSTAKLVAAGKKIKYTVFADGVEIDTRTTGKGKGYQAAIACRSNYTWAVARNNESIKYHQGEKTKYEGWLANPEAALASEKPGFHRDHLAKSLQDGTVQKWIASAAEYLEKCLARQKELAGMTQDSPEFCVWKIYGYSNTGKLPNKEWLYQETLVTLTQPAEAA